MIWYLLSTGSVIEIVVTKDDVVDGIFYQDKEMRHMYLVFLRWSL